MQIFSKAIERHSYRYDDWTNCKTYKNLHFKSEFNVMGMLWPTGTSVIALYHLINSNIIIFLPEIQQYPP